MPGGGITARNVERIVAAARPREIHFAALEPVAGGMRFRRQHVFMGGELRPPEYDRLVTSVASVRVGDGEGVRLRLFNCGFGTVPRHVISGREHRNGEEHAI